MYCLCLHTIDVGDAEEYSPHIHKVREPIRVNETTGILLYSVHPTRDEANLAEVELRKLLRQHAQLSELQIPPRTVRLHSVLAARQPPTGPGLSVAVCTVTGPFSCRLQAGHELIILLVTTSADETEALRQEPAPALLEVYRDTSSCLPPPAPVIGSTRVRPETAVETRSTATHNT
jgi:hypothetical protein